MGTARKVLLAAGTVAGAGLVAVSARRRGGRRAGSARETGPVGARPGAGTGYWSSLVNCGEAGRSYRP